MRTRIDLDDKLVREAARLTGIKSTRALVAEALRALIHSRKRRSLLELRGRIRFADGCDHEALRHESA